MDQPKKISYNFYVIPFVNNNFRQMEKIIVWKCIPNFTLRRCYHCCQNIDETKTECPICQIPFEDLCPIWHFYFTISKADDIDKKKRIEGYGPIFDNVMGMTIQDLLYISKTLGDLTNEVIRFFTKNSFLVTHSIKRINSISLTMGNQMTFQKWLGIQQNTSPEEIADLLLSQMNQFDFLPNYNDNF